MMRNASLFLNIFHVHDQLYFFKETSKSNPLFAQQSLSNLSIKISNSAYECTQKVNSMTPKSDHQKCETTPIRLIHASFYHYILFRPSLLHQPFWVPHKNQSTLLQCISSGHPPFSIFLPQVLPILLTIAFQNDLTHFEQAVQSFLNTRLFGDFLDSPHSPLECKCPQEIKTLKYAHLP